MTKKEYTELRHVLIPLATAKVRVEKTRRKGKNFTKDEQDRFFHKSMLELAVESGLIHPGNLTLFHADQLPDWSNPNLGRRR